MRTQQLEQLGVETPEVASAISTIRDAIKATEEGLFRLKQVRRKHAATDPCQSLRSPRCARAQTGVEYLILYRRG